MSVKVNLAPLKRFPDDVRRGLAGRSGPIRDAVRVWAAMYRSFAQERFKVQSRGGGEWPPLKDSTVKRRRKGRRGSNAPRASILWNTGTLVGGLTPRFVGAPGQLQEDIPFGVRVGYGPDPHPGSNGRVTVKDLAQWHQTGAGNLPERPIIVDPDRRTVQMMADEMEDAIRRSLRQNGFRS
jgi:hypothetical protein